MDNLKQEWIDSNKLRIPLIEKEKVGPSPVTLPGGTAERLLNKERQEPQLYKTEPHPL
jgi:hypothetical protein